MSLTIGAGRAGTDLVLNAFDRERAWWARVPATFEAGWWENESGASFAEAKAHHDRALTLVDSLRGPIDEPDVGRLRALRDTWVAQPGEVAFGAHLRFALDSLIFRLSDPEPRR